ncbi:bifunctional 4-hydroxy-2-oxoglutarate aldolase/2-dehydro-3-deoxy-phosphogluconate aldolase [Nocardioides sp.]|uniref:bifunctional 4-hydroxy-2-oxoglutarate aldolase/2-dehydro-3-deoxy-phosphogluconate aldolase n=1 Tax=Nocardioides sp. TaxID=35761 RepID=UPI002637E97A|nr:bifunctional 4-hydroxy-2-oxoglutarate aldolase/2-dehydro-3-deoxy-phosphogluconate aldolase [Nocardioides sp.]MCW2736854.1 kdgA [Nocardioides sp.]
MSSARTTGDESLATILAEDRIAAVLRGREVSDPAALTRALATAGIRCVEFTLTLPDAVEAMAEARGVVDAFVGAGTVTTAAEAERVISAGAQFVVSPGLALDVVGPCREAGIPFVLGAYTPSEVMAAVRAGSAVVKLFPAGLGGPRYLRDLRGPFPEVPLVPSGGVSVDNVAAFLAAGAVAAFAGSDLVPREAVENGELDGLVARAKRYRAVIAER